MLYLVFETYMYDYKQYEPKKKEQGVLKTIKREEIRDEERIGTVYLSFNRDFKLFV